MLSKQFCVMGNLILHGKFNMIGGGGFRNFPRQLPKCKDVSKFLTKIVVLIQPQATAPWGPKCSPRPMAHSLFKSRQISINPRTEVEYQRTRFWLPVYQEIAKEYVAVTVQTFFIDRMNLKCLFHTNN